MIVYSVNKGDRCYIVTPSWEGAIKAKSFLKSRGIKAGIRTHSTKED